MQHTPLPFKTYDEVVAAFKAGAKFETRGHYTGITCPVVSIERTATGIKVDGGLRLGPSYGFRPDGSNPRAAVTLVMTEAAPVAPPPHSRYFVARVDAKGGLVPKFSESPRPHETYAAAAREADRLAAKHPGALFNVYAELARDHHVPRKQTLIVEIARSKEGRLLSRTYRKGTYTPSEIGRQVRVGLFVGEVVSVIETEVDG